MTVAALPSIASYVEDSVTTAFPAPFRFKLPTDLMVERLIANSVPQPLVLGVDYTVSGGTTDAGGTVTRLVATAGATLMIRRHTARAQPMVYTTGDRFPAVSHEQALDRAMLIDQEQDDDLADVRARTSLAPVGETIGLLPAATARAGRTIAFDANGNPVPGPTLDDLNTAILNAVAALTNQSVASAVLWLQAGAGVVPRTVQDKLREYTPSVRDRGAQIDGIADATAALLASDGAGPWRLTAGRYRVTASITLASAVQFDVGAVLVPDAGVTIGFLGAIVAPPVHIFDGAGSVDLSQAIITEAYPEWWGAVCNTGVDTYDAIVAAYNAVGSRKLKFQAADYFISQTWVVDRSNSHVEFCGRDYIGVANQVTRILAIGGSVVPLQIGPTEEPDTINQYPTGIHVRGGWMARTVAPNIDSDCASIAVQFVLDVLIVNVAAAESMNNWKIYGAVYGKLIDPKGFRSTVGTTLTGAVDYWFNFKIGGPAIPTAAGGNASLYLIRASASFGNVPPANSTNILIIESYTDTFVDFPETTGGAVGIQISGNGIGSSYTSNTDLKVNHPTCDGHTVAGIFAHDVSPGGSLSVIEPYCGCSGAATGAIVLTDNKGTTRISGGQLPMSGSPGSPGVRAAGCAVVIIDGTAILECSSADGAVILTDCNAGKIEPVATNTSATLQRIVKVTNSNAMKLGPIAEGSAGLIKAGVQIMDATSARNKIECTGIDSGAIAGGSANKLIIAGTPVTMTGIAASGSGSNVVSGVMA